MVWTQNDIDIAKNLWENTKTPSAEIGLLIDKTKNAIIGKARRLGWKMRDQADINRRNLTPEERERREALSARSASLRLEKRRLKAEAEANRKAEEVAKAKAHEEALERMRTPKMINLFDAGEGHCRNIIGEPKNMIVCGNPCVAGKSYCAHHNQLNYIPTNNHSPTIRSYVEARR